MMIVPRQYVKAQPRRTQSSEFSEKATQRSTRSPLNSPRAQSPLSPSQFRVREPSPSANEPRRSSVRLQPQKPEHQDVPQRPQPTPQQEKDVPRLTRESAKNVLSATAIPIRRKHKGRVSQRLPRGDHVTNFSSLLMDDIKPSLGGSLPRSVSSSNFEGLFGNMDELLEDGQMYIGSEGLDSGILITRSMSNDSLVSLPSPDDFTVSDRNSQHSNLSQSIVDRKMRPTATSEDCSHDHPLSPPNEANDLFGESLEMPVSPTPVRTLPGKPEKKPRQSLKSSLTASLKALKSAAQSVSSRTSNESDNARARSYFDFHPGLTDDRRPPPSLDEPTPELRRYLNPPPLDSAAQLHFWQDHRHSQFEPKARKETRKKTLKSRLGRSSSQPGSNPIVRDLPPIVQLANCLPPSVRTENASSPPIWLTSDGTPVNKNTAIPLLFDPNANEGKGEPVGVRHREPRENRDFLRVFVCEMQMRRSGKLSEDLSAGRARLWLPPVGSSDRNATTKKEGDAVVVPAEGRVKQKKAARDRMVCTSIEDI